MLTARDLQSNLGRLLLGHRCGWRKYADIDSVPEALLDRTIEDLWREGRWKCGNCGGRPAAMVYIYDGSMTRQVERWADDDP